MTHLVNVKILESEAVRIIKYNTCTFFVVVLNYKNKLYTHYITLQNLNFLNNIPDMLPEKI